MLNRILEYYSSRYSFHTSKYKLIDNDTNYVYQVEVQVIKKKWNKRSSKYKLIDNETNYTYQVEVQVSNQKEMKQKIPGKCLFIKRDDNETLTRDPTLVKIKYNLQW